MCDLTLETLTNSMIISSLNHFIKPRTHIQPVLVYFVCNSYASDSLLTDRGKSKGVTSNKEKCENGRLNV